MYKYPTVPRLNPKEIPLPKCMYSVRPIFDNTFDSPVMNDHCEDGDNDNSELQFILEKQESVLNKLAQLEARLQSMPISDVDLIEAQMKCLLIRQDKLVTSIDSLEARLKNAAISDVLKTVATSSTGDISIFVNWSSMPTKLKSYIKFFKTQGLKILIQIHKHSSIEHLKLENIWNEIHDKNPELNRVEFDGTITFIVREQCTLEPILVVDPQNHTATIEGDDNIIKFLDQRFGHLLRSKH